MTKPKFIKFENSEWEKYYSNLEYPTIDSVVIKERKEIGRQGIYTLTINKVESIYGSGYMVGIWSGPRNEKSKMKKLGLSILLILMTACGIDELDEALYETFFILKKLTIEKWWANMCEK